jgi:predicted DNA-binding protein with PD1-like motif
MMAPMTTRDAASAWPLRLHPGDDLRRALEQAVHMHGLVADAQGRVWGGHAAYGCIVRTTAEVLLAPLPDWHFTREPDSTTGWSELVVRRRDGCA